MTSYIQWNNFYGTVIYPTIPGLMIKEEWIKCSDRVFYTDFKGENLEDKDIQRTEKVLKGICQYLRKIKHGYLVFHDLKGSKCSFTAEKHYHLVSECPHKEGKTRNGDCGIWSIQSFKDLRDTVNSNMFALKSERVKYMENMTGYLKQPPRQLVGCTSRAMDIHYSETPVKETEEKPKKRKREDCDDDFESPKKRKTEEKRR